MEGELEGGGGINKDGWRFFVVVSLYFDDTRYTPNRGGFRRQGGMEGRCLEEGVRLLAANGRGGRGYGGRG